MRYLIATSILFLASLSACAPAGNSSAEATLIALSVQLTLAAQSSEAPMAATEAAPSSTPTAAPVLPTEAPTETETPEPAEEAEDAFEVPDWPLFRNGDQGAEVYAIQHLLRAHGYNLTVDGKFGPQTRTEVRNFQIAKGLGADGIVGPQTWAALIQGKQVDQGDSGQAVRALQVLLRSKFGYNTVNVDADFGPLTDAAVRDFQNEYDLVVDGIVGPDTWQALIAIQP